MHYLTHSNDITAAIATWSQNSSILWLDTEIADWQTSNPRLSLIQVLSSPYDRTGDKAFVFDVLDQPNLIQAFIQRIMADSQIEKVFHNASFDLRYLGRAQAQNVTCTLKLARQIGKHRLKTSNLKLKTLATELCRFSNVDASEQSSDWGQRDLSPSQLYYAAMDVVYLAAVHRSLLEISNPKALTQIDAISANPMSSEPSKASPKPIAPQLSPTKVRTAFECPRLFYLGQRQGLNTLFIPQDGQVGVGKPFHAMADRLIDYLQQNATELTQLFQVSPNELDETTIARLIQRQFYAQVFFPYLTTLQEKHPDQADGLLRIWQGISSLIGQLTRLLVANRSRLTAEQLISQTFPRHNRKLKHTFTLPNGASQTVIGEYDCLVFDAIKQRLCVLELKTYAPLDPTAQLAQAALYSYLLWTQEQRPIDAAVYCVLPEFQTFDYAWEQLENTVHQLIPHKLQQMQEWLTWQDTQPNPPPETPQAEYLCSICPQQTPCHTTFGNNIVQPTTAATKAKTIEPITTNAETIEPTTNAEVMGQKLVETFSAFGVETIYEGAAIGPAFVRVKLKPQLGVKVNAMTKLADDLRVQLGLTSPPMIAPQTGFVSVDLPRSDRQIAHFNQYIQAQSMPPDQPMKIAIGVNLDGTLCEADLSDPNTCHFLVGGTTGSGKSEFLKALLFSLLVRYSPQHLKIVLVDPKRVTFPEFEQMPWLLAPVVKDGETAIEIMQQLVNEMESRYRQFEDQQCNDLPTYNRKFADRPEKHLPRIVCIFDEYADFMSEKETANSLEQSIKRLGAMARAAGIHLIIATQRPEAKVVTPLIRSNLPGRVALRTASAADSAIILGDKTSDAVNLLGKGDLLYLSSSKKMRLQSLFAGKINFPTSDFK